MWTLPERLNRPLAYLGLLLLPLTGFVLVSDLYRNFHHDSEDLLACEFSRPTATDSIAPRKGQKMAGKLRIEARLRPLGDDPRLRALSGSANWPTRDDWRDAMVLGDIAVAADGKVETLNLDVSYPGWRGQSLSIGTLSSDGGFWGRDREKAYLFFDKESRMAYPVAYGCRIDRRPAHWGWS